jgi:predicted RND superfamily exporter protein
MILDNLGRGVSKAPAATVVVILLLTVFFGYFATQTNMESREEDFNPDSEIAQASSRVSDYFGAEERTVQIIARDPDGKDGDVLTQASLMAILELEADIIEPQEGKRNITETLAHTESIPTGVQSIADLIGLGAMTLQGAQMFGDQMQQTGTALGGMSENLTLLAGGLAYMNVSDPASVGETLVTTEYALAMMVTGIQEMMGSGSGNGNGGFPNVTTLQAVIGAMDDAAIKGSIVGMNTFDPAPLKGLVSMTLAQRDATLSTADPAHGVLGGPLVGLLNDTDFMAGNYTYMGAPVDQAMLIDDSLAHLNYITIALGALSSVENQPDVMANVLAGLAGGLTFTLSKDYQPGSTQPRAKASLMLVQQNGSMDSKVILESQYDLEDMAKLVEADHKDTIEFGIMGGEILFDKINTSSMSSLGTLMVLAIVFIIVILFIVFLNGKDTLFTLSALLIVIVWTFGLGVILGYTFNPLTIAVPILLVGLAVDYGIHLTVRNRLEKREKPLTEATVETITSVGMALLLATVTTVFSFMSNAISDLSVMRQFGFLTSIGIVSAFFVMVTFVPACRLLVDRRRERLGKRRGSPAGKGNGPRKEKRLERFVQLGAKGAGSHGVYIVVVAVVISGVSFYAITDISVEFDFMDFLPSDLPEAETITYLFDNFNFSSSTSTVLMEGNVAEGAVMVAIHDSQENMVDSRDVVMKAGHADIRSPLTVAQAYGMPTSPSYDPGIGAIFAASDTNGDGVPDENVSMLMDAIMANPASARDMGSVLHPDGNGGYDAAVIRVGVVDSADGGKALSDDLNDDVKPILDLADDGQLKDAIVTDGPVLTYAVVSSITAAGLESVLLTIVAAAILLVITFYIAFRTFMVGLLTTVPIVLVIGWVFGTMKLMDIPINVVTVMVAALTVGLGITYAIHISHRFLEDLEKEPWRDALCSTVGHTGAALFGAAATTIGGFGILTFSILPPMAQFGIVTAMSILYSFLASVFVLPSFLALWARRKYGDDEGSMCQIGEGPEGEIPDEPGEAPIEDTPEEP